MNNEFMDKEFNALIEFLEDFLPKKNCTKNQIKTCNITKHQSKEGILQKLKILTADICDNCNGLGVKSDFSLNNCPLCNGTKKVNTYSYTILGKLLYTRKCKNCKCKSCYGNGYIFTEKEITIKVPPNVKNNDCIVFKNKGNQIKADEKRGNLYIVIHIFGSKSKRKGKKIYC